MAKKVQWWFRLRPEWPKAKHVAPMCNLINLPVDPGVIVDPRTNVFPPLSVPSKDATKSSNTWAASFSSIYKFGQLVTEEIRMPIVHTCIHINLSKAQSLKQGFLRLEYAV